VQYGLPRLSTFDDFDRLTNEELQMYLDRYNIRRAGRLDRDAKLRKLRAFISCIAVA
jgi:hypothetical protein